MKDTCKKTQWNEMISWLPVLGLLMLLSAIPFGWSAYQRISLYILGVGYLTDYIVNRRWQSISWNRGKWIYIVMLLFVVLFFVREWFDPTPLTDYAKLQFHLHEWFLYVGIVGLLGFSDKLQLRHVAYVLLATSVVMELMVFGLYFFTDEVTELKPFFRFNWLRSHHINSHMVMNLYINTAIIMGFSVLKEETTRWRKVILLLAIFLSWSLIMLSDGRNGQATSILVLMVCGLLVIPRKHWYIGLIFGILVAISTGLVVTLNPRISSYYVVHNPRVAIFDYSWRMVKQKPITGYGLSTLSIEYVEGAYQDSIMYNGFVASHLEGMPEFAKLGKTMKTHHAHNAILHYWLIFGIAGPIFLLVLFIVAAMMPIEKRYRPYLWLFLLAVFIQGLTEPIGQHITPQFITLILLVWQCAALPTTTKQKIDESCES